jgi:hypothetical protein
MKLRVVFQAALCAGALLAIVGGGAIGICTFIDPNMEILRRLDQGYQHVIFGFVFLTLFAVASAVIDTLSRVGRPAPAPEPAPAPASAPVLPAPLPEPMAGKKVDPSRLANLYHEMKTYIDLEMWELAMEKANLIVEQHPGTKEADLVSRNLNELRWKAEPKFVAAHANAPLAPSEEKQLREKGLAAMYNHVKTYMDLDMWELARQKAVSIMKSFPESPEAVELMKIYETIERKAKAVPEPGKVESTNL